MHRMWITHFLFKKISVTLEYKFFFFFNDSNIIARPLERNLAQGDGNTIRTGEPVTKFALVPLPGISPSNQIILLQEVTTQM